MLKDVLFFWLNLVLKSNQNIVQFEIIIGEASFMCSFNDFDHLEPKVKDALIAHIAFLTFEIFLKILAKSWHNHIRCQNWLLCFLFVFADFIIIFGDLDEHSIIDHFWSGAWLISFKNFVDLLEGLPHGVDFISKQLSICRYFDD